MNPSRRKIEVNIVSSNYHIELTPRYGNIVSGPLPRVLTDSTSSCSDAGSYDRLVIQDILKEIAQTQQVDQNAKHKFKGS